MHVHEDPFSKVILTPANMVHVEIRGKPGQEEWCALRDALLLLFDMLHLERRAFATTCDVACADLSVTQVIDMVSLLFRLRHVLTALNTSTTIVMSTHSRRVVDLLLSLYTPTRPLEILERVH